MYREILKSINTGKHLLSKSLKKFCINTIQKISISFQKINGVERIFEVKNLKKGFL